MAMRSVVLFLLHQRDTIDKMMTLDIYDKHDFEWLSKVKVSWHEAEAGTETPVDGPVV